MNMKMKMGNGACACEECGQTLLRSTWLCQLFHAPNNI